MFDIVTDWVQQETHSDCILSAYAILYVIYYSPSPACIYETPKSPRFNNEKVKEKMYIIVL